MNSHLVVILINSHLVVMAVQEFWQGIMLEDSCAVLLSSALCSLPCAGLVCTSWHVVCTLAGSHHVRRMAITSTLGAAHAYVCEVPSTSPSCLVCGRALAQT